MARSKDFPDLVEILNHAKGQIERIEFEAKVARVILEDVATRCAVDLRAAGVKPKKPSSKRR